jgi:hypothetical protein
MRHPKVLHQTDCRGPRALTSHRSASVVTSLPGTASCLRRVAAGPMPPPLRSKLRNSSHRYVRLHPRVLRFIPVGCCHPDRNWPMGWEPKLSSTCQRTCPEGPVHGLGSVEHSHSCELLLPPKRRLCCPVSPPSGASEDVPSGRELLRPRPLTARPLPGLLQATLGRVPSRMAAFSMPESFENHPPCALPESSVRFGWRLSPESGILRPGRLRKGDRFSL